ncbi:MAG: OmpA family protein [Rhizobacter sp.]|nr:OmpA family protein [Rhizobacter sp.]
MKRPLSSFVRAAGVSGLVAAAFVALVLPMQPAFADDSLDLGSKVPTTDDIKEGLFPEDTCKELQAAGYKCMGFKPAVKYSLPATNFKVGSADLPDGLRKQLDVFADVLRTKKGSSQVVRIEGHADALGAAEANLELSQRRAESVKTYLVSKGADEGMLSAVGVGTAELKNPANPYGAENRRVEIGRQN